VLHCVFSSNPILVIILKKVVQEVQRLLRNQVGIVLEKRGEREKGGDNI
jgi:hypothetical protein